MMKRLSLKNLKIGIEEIILVILIILQFLDFFEIIGSNLDYVKKIISWALIGLLIYNIRLSKLFVGVNSGLSDSLLIFGYFSLTLKNLTSYAAGSLVEASAFLHDFFQLLASNSSTIESVGIYVGFLLIIFVSLRLSLKEFNKPSIIGVFHLIDAKPDSFRKLIPRFFKVFFIVFGFFVVFFNLIIEWLAIAIDAPLLMFGLLLYLLFLVRFHKGFSFGKFLVKFGDFGSSLYKQVIKNLRYRKTFIQSVSAMIVLHVITDAYTFVWPFLFGFGDGLYLNLLPDLHLSFLNVFLNQISYSSLSVLDSISLLLIYAGNVVALLFFLLFPVFLWFVIFNKKIIYPKRFFLSIVVSSLSMFILAPIFKIKPLFDLPIVGVDFLGHASSSMISFSSVLLFSFALGIFIEFFSVQINHERIVLGGLSFISLAWLFYYLFNFMISYFNYFFDLLSSLLSSHSWILFAFFLMVILFLFCFYVVGFIGFVLETIKFNYLIFKEKL